MITEDYVSYEIAKLLKEKGFDVPCKYAFHGGIEVPDFHRHSRNFNGDDYKNLRSEWYTAPTLQMAMKWLREVHNIHISVNPIVDYVEDADGRKYRDNVYWAFDFMNSESGEFIEIPNNDYQFDTYKDAIEDAIKYCLTKLI